MGFEDLPGRREKGQKKLLATGDGNDSLNASSVELSTCVMILIVAKSESTRSWIEADWALKGVW